MHACAQDCHKRNFHYTLPLSLSAPLSVCRSLCLPPCLPLSLSESLSLFLSFSLSLFLSFSLSLFRESQLGSSAAPQDGRGASSTAFTSAGTACRMAAPGVPRTPCFPLWSMCAARNRPPQAQGLAHETGSDRLERRSCAGDSR